MLCYVILFYIILYYTVLHYVSKKMKCKEKEKEDDLMQTNFYETLSLNMNKLL